MVLNENDVNIDQSVKVSTIEIVENNVNTAEMKSNSDSTEMKPILNKQTSNKQTLNINLKENENNEMIESSIVTADYIQQSMFP